MPYKSQHYIPQSYLRGFVDPNTPPNEEPYLWVCERECGNPFRRSPKNLAQESYYYSFRDESGELQHEVEKALSALKGPGMVESLRKLAEVPSPDMLDDE